MDEHEALDVLGLRGPVEAAEVKRAYRRLARELHPDAGGDAASFQRVRRAYEVIGEGTSLRTGPAPQQRVASVDDRWWDGGAAWHEDTVDLTGVDLERAVPADAVVAADVDLLATLLCEGDPVAPVRLHSRAPGSRLHRFISWLDPELLAALEVGPATEGRRPGHDVAVEVRASGGRGRRLLQACEPPGSWTLARGSETARLRRVLRPSRRTDETAVRVARDVEQTLAAIGWPLGEWYLLPHG